MPTGHWPPVMETVKRADCNSGSWVASTRITTGTIPMMRT
jgi:hypothetical protein